MIRKQGFSKDLQSLEGPEGQEGLEGLEVQAVFRGLEILVSSDGPGGSNGPGKIMIPEFRD